MTTEPLVVVNELSTPSVWPASAVSAPGGDLSVAGVSLLELPDDVRPGDVLAVPASGAYQVSMASGYNMTGRPPVVAVADGRSRLLVRRETFEDQRSRDVGL